MTSDDLRRALEDARMELDAAGRALAPKHKGGEWERFDAANAKCISLERDLARSLDEECAVDFDWPAPWSVGAPMPHVMSSGGKTAIVYLQRERDPNWDGSHATPVNPTTPDHQLVATVTFRRCLVHKFGAPNDETLSGHRLHGRGLTGYRAHIVERSRWLREHERINSVHLFHNPERFRDYVHYVLPFHDDTFECLATGFELHESLSTFPEALQRCASDLLG
jgi:hypothetical protein